MNGITTTMNIERRDNAPRLSLAEQQWHATQDAEYERIEVHARLLNNACAAIRAIGPQLSNADIVQMLEVLGSNIAHLPAEREMIDAFAGELECAA